MSTTSSNSQTQAYLTPRGVSSPLKDALLDRYHHVRSAFNQPAFIESLNLPAQILADIWLPVGFPPVSLEPLNEEEEKVAQTGHFTNANIRSRVNQKYGHNGGEYGSSPSGNNGPVSNNYNNNTNRQNNRGYNQRNFRNHQNGSQQSSSSSYSRFQTAHRHEFDRRQEHEDDDVIEDPDNLWAIPSADAVGSSDFGSFDENGLFRTGGVPDNNLLLEGGLEDLSSSSAATFESFMQTRPQAKAPAPEPTPVVPTSPPVAIPTITPNTLWLYRDPSGQIQGPFPSHRMMEWYNGKYFPESLPLRRENDSFFEPLSAWKIKCAGQVPFAAYSKTTNPEPAIEKPVIEKIVEAPAKPVPTAASVASTVINANAPRSVPLESLFGNSPAVVLEKPSSPEVLMPGSSSAAAGWKKLEKPSFTAKFGQLDLNEPVVVKESIETPIVVAATSTNNATANTTANTTANSNSNTTANTNANSSTTPIATNSTISPSATWSTGSNMKKISLSEIMKSTAAADEPEIILSKESTIPTASLSSSSSVGWAKVSATPVKPLSAIQAEEAARQSERAKQSASSAPTSKSFADLVRSAGVITSGDIVVSPSISEIKPNISESAFKPPVSALKKPEPIKTSTNITTTNTTTNTVNVNTAININSHNDINNNSTTSLEDWCIASLKTSPALSKSIDPQVCTSLLLDLPNPTSILTFALETLKPLDTTGSLDMADFAKEFSTRKFGPKATEKVQWAKLKSIPSSAFKQEESFEVVKRKK